MESRKSRLPSFSGCSISVLMEPEQGSGSVQQAIKSRQSCQTVIWREKGYQWDQRVLHAGKCLLYMYKPVIIPGGA